MGAKKLRQSGSGELFECDPENVVFTGNCTQGLNMAIHTLVKPGSRVIISGFEHNAVTRPVYARTDKVTVAGRRLFDWEDTLKSWEQALKKGADAAIFTHVSNVFGYILPVQQLSELCFLLWMRRNRQGFYRFPLKSGVLILSLCPAIRDF